MVQQPIKNLDQLPRESVEALQQVPASGGSGYNPLIYGNDVDSVDVASRVAMVIDGGRKGCRLSWLLAGTAAAGLVVMVTGGDGRGLCFEPGCLPFGDRWKRKFDSAGCVG